MGELISPSIRIVFLFPFPFMFPAEIEMFPFCIEFIISEKLILAAIILYMSTAISTSLSRAPLISAFFISGRSSISF